MDGSPDKSCNSTPHLWCDRDHIRWQTSFSLPFWQNGLDEKMLLCAEIDVMFVVVGSRKGQAQRYQTRLWEYRQIVVKNNRYSFCHYYSFSYIWREMGTTYLHKPFEKLRKLSFRHQKSDICMVARSPITVSRFSAKISWNNVKFTLFTENILWNQLY